MQTIQGLVLRIVKYSDAASIATVWTKQMGRISVRLPSGSGREARQRRAIMMPMSVFEAVAITRPGFDIVNLKDVRSLSSVAQGNPAAGVVAMFLADFLYVALKDSGTEIQLSDFLFESAAALGRLKGTALANFHLWFMVHLGHFLGIAPDFGSYDRGKYLDLKEGRYTPTLPLHSHWLEPAASRLAYVVSQASMRHLPIIRLSRQQRNAFVDAVLDYYTLHHTPISSLPSLPIVREIFS